MSQECKLIAYEKDDKIYIVVGFDVLSQNFISRNITDVYSLYNPIDLNTIKPYSIDTLIKKLTEEKEYLEKYYNVYDFVLNGLIQEAKRKPDTYKYKSELISHSHIFRRIKECEKQKEIVLDKLQSNPNDENLLKQLNDINKGLKRANKRLYHFYNGKNYNLICEYLHQKDFNYSLLTSKRKIKELDKNIKALEYTKTKLLGVLF